jgi:hypothetical protein
VWRYLVAHPAIFHRSGWFIAEGRGLGPGTHFYLSVIDSALGPEI